VGPAWLKWSAGCAECGYAFDDPDEGCDRCEPLKVSESGGTAELFREELVQCVAVAMAALQAHDRMYP